jgi:hypothetical protein
MQRINKDAYNNTQDKKLKPDAGCVYKINNTEYGVKQYNSEYYIVSLVPGFL